MNLKAVGGTKGSEVRVCVEMSGAKPSVEAVEAFLRLKSSQTKKTGRIVCQKQVDWFPRQFVRNV